MTDTPADTPVTIPPVELMVATDVLTLVQPPPETPSLSVIIAPTHTGTFPVMPVGVGLTVIVSASAQPPVTVYEIMVVPRANPDTIPEDAPMVATVVLPLTHVPATPSVSVIVDPTHTADGPPIAVGDA